MTCVVGLIAPDGSIWIGGDSAATNNSDQQTIRADQKIFRLGDFLFGCTSSYRMIQLLRYRLVLPDDASASRENEEDHLFRYLATDFIDAVRTCLQGGGYAKKENEREEGGVFLVGWQGRLFCIASDYQIEETHIGYHAIGSADDIALGALHATRQLNFAPDQRIRLALGAAAYHNATVREPFIVKSIEFSAQEGNAPCLKTMG
ncbi:MAG: hypothetical protein H0U76_04030 [Ktedonobacteraceae bacterium]|nr:hypothetical protein [Ktedonobacteraceae bacterium]